ncbi:MAG: helicase [Bacteroidales bacterium]|nr:helicase [Bacteroidales bacterium]
MPKIYDNIENILIEGLKQTIRTSFRADFCVGYFNLRGWDKLADLIDQYQGKENECCKLLIGMQKPSSEILREHLATKEPGLMDNATALALKKKIALEFRSQLMFGLPTQNDEESLRKLSLQLKQRKVIVKLFLRHSLHAKLYLIFREDPITPAVGYVGSSNLTLAGLEKQGELNLDVLEQDAANKLTKWFEDRWIDQYCIDISDELAAIIDESWAGDKLIKPYFIYLKIAWHLSQEAQLGLNNFLIPKIFGNDLLPFQQSAVLIAARHLDKRGGVLIGDVVGLGKTLTATALTKVFEETFYLETLVICPKNITEMWEDYFHRYQIRGKVKSISMIDEKFLNERRYRVVIIDESHNLRNRDGKRYSIIKDYLERNECKVILLTATPYNKIYFDISNQLRLFIPEEQDLGVSPERFINELQGGATEFVSTYQYQPNTLLAFEKSDYPEDWQTLLKLYMVRRTRTFIKENYATFDDGRNQYFLTFSDGSRFYFPDRIPKKIEYDFDPLDDVDIYAKLYSENVVLLINSLQLARYGLANYIDPAKEDSAGNDDKLILANLSRAGKRLMGFCRTNLFKRLESCGFSFIISVSRHLMRNYVYIHAIKNGLKLPIGRQENESIDEFLEENDADTLDQGIRQIKTDVGKFMEDAATAYERNKHDKKLTWIDPEFFTHDLIISLQHDCKILLEVLNIAKYWDPKADKKLKSLEHLCKTKHPKDKILIFSQFADTVDYLKEELNKRKIDRLEAVTGNIENPTSFAHRFSPVSNKKTPGTDDIRIMLSTDVLSEGQNLQDAHVIVNFDLPWALIRLIQRAGRVDRIGQHHPEILCYSFLPADGLNNIIRLRDRLSRRIRENAEYVGADEVFFDGDPVNIRDLYNEKAGILDEEEDTEVDLTSTAFEIWNQAIKARPELKKIIPSLPNVIYSTMPKPKQMVEGEGVVTYHKTASDVDILTWIGMDQRVISKSQSRILKAIACDYDTPELEKMDQHHDLVKLSLEYSSKDEQLTGGQLGKKSGARYKVYMILTRYIEEFKNTLFDTDSLKKAIGDIYKYPLRESAKDILNRRLRIGVTDDQLAAIVVELRNEGRLCLVEEESGETLSAPQIICSMGIKNQTDLHGKTSF